MSTELIIGCNNLSAYIAYARSIPCLSQKEEEALAIESKWNPEAAKKLILAHLKWVVSIAARYKGYGLLMEDLIQEGNIGLMKAVKKYDPTKKVRLASFSVVHIKNEILEFVQRNWSIVRVTTTKPLKKLFFNMKNYMQHHDSTLTPQTVEKICEDLNVKPHEIDIMHHHRCDRDISFDPDPNDDNNSLSPSLTLSDHNEEINAFRDLSTLNHVNDKMKEILSDRELEILRARYISSELLTLKELSEHFNISIERVRQIEKVAIKKLKKEFA